MQKQQAGARGAASASRSCSRRSSTTTRRTSSSLISKAVGEATASQGAEVSGALPRCCAMLRDTLRAQQDEQEKLQKQMTALASREARSCKARGRLEGDAHEDGRHGQRG